MRWGYKLALTGEATFLGINFGKGASHTGKNFGMKKRWVGGYQDDSEENGDFQKEVKRVFDEKRL